MEKENKRDYKLDLLRVIAIAMIVLMHSPKPSPASTYNGVIIASMSYLTASGIGLFFMISGALLLGTKQSTKDFLKRRFSKILFPTLFWSAVYLFVKCTSSSLTVQDVVVRICSIPFSAQGHGVLWFMYTLAGLYLLTPILSKWLKNASKREVEFYLVLWGITLLYPYLSLVLNVNETHTGILYYFAGYGGYFLLGYYLKRYYKYNTYHILLALLIIVGVPGLMVILGVEFDLHTFLWYLSLPVALMSFCFYAVVSHLNIKRTKIIERISELSFGIYLMHVLILQKILWNSELMMSIPGTLQVPVLALMAFVLSVVISEVVSRLPFSKYIIGV